MSDAETEEAPRFFRLAAPYAQIRVINRQPTYQQRGPWVARGATYGAVLSTEDVHPKDIEHLSRAVMTVRHFETDRYGTKILVREQVPMIVPIDAPA